MDAGDRKPWLAPALLALALAPLPLASDPPWARTALGLLAVLCLYLYLRQTLGQAGGDPVQAGLGRAPGRCETRPPQELSWRLAQTMAAGYFLLATLSPLWSVVPDASVAWLPVWLAAAAAFWLLSQAEADRLWRLTLVLAGTGALQALLGVALSFLPGSRFAGSGSLGYRGAFAALLLAAALAAAGGALGGPWPWRRWLWGVAALALGVVATSGSRLTQLLALPALLALALLWPAPERRRAVRGLALAVLAALALGALLLWARPPQAAPGPGGQLWPGEFIPAATDQAVAGRLDAWRAALAMLREHPLLGAGVMGFSRLYGLHQTNWALWVIDAHSTWLQAAADLGLPGLLCLAGAWLAVAWAALRRLRRGPAAPRPLLLALGLPAAVLVLHGSADLDYNLPAVALWTWALLGATLAAGAPAAGTRPWPGPLARQAWLLRGVLLPLAALGVTYGLVGPPVAAGYVQTARQRLAAGDARGAVVATDSANWWRPTSLGWAWQGAALAHLAETGGGDPFRRQALGAVQHAIARDPFNPALYSQLAGLQESLGDRLAASASLRRAVSLQPYHPRFRVELAEVLVRSADTAGALDLLADLADHWDHYAWLGAVNFGTEAQTDWYRRSRLDLTQVALALGQRQRALDALQELAQRYPGDPAVTDLQRRAGL